MVCAASTSPCSWTSACSSPLSPNKSGRDWSTNPRVPSTARSDGASGGGPSQPEDVTRLRGRRHRSLERLRDVDHALDELRVALGRLASPVVDVVLQAGADVAAEDDAHRRERELVGAEPQCVEQRAVGEVVDAADEVQRTGREQRAGAEDERRVDRIGQLPALQQLVHLVQVPVVEHLEFGFDSPVDHLLVQGIDRPPRVLAGDVVVAIHRSHVERGHLRRRVGAKRLFALVVGRAGPARGVLDDDVVGVSADGVVDLLEPLRCEGALAVVRARVDMNDRRPRLLDFPYRATDLLRRLREVRVSLLPVDAAGQCRGDDDKLAIEVRLIAHSSPVRSR